MTLEDLGYDDTLEKYKTQQNLDVFEVGRVILEHKERYVIRTAENEFDAELLGNLRFTAESRSDFPAVGDWVAFSEYDDGKGLIHAIYPRVSVIERQAAGTSGQIQIIATNVDYGLIVQAVDRDFNLNRLERYLTICYASDVIPVIVLSKTDLVNTDELQLLRSRISERIPEIQLLTVNNQKKGYIAVEALIEKGKTYCLLGSSGVGKSTLINILSGDQHMKTGEISSSVNKGKHITSHRELIVLKKGGILIDNPGMREVGIADSTAGLETTFEAILSFAAHCRFNDCTHQHETGCAILEALENGDIDPESYANFQKMEKEKAHFASDAIARKKKEKYWGKIIKDVQKQRKKDKY